MHEMNTIDIEAENDQVERMETELATDPTAVKPSPVASCQLPTATLLADLMDETTDRVEGIGFCMIDVGGALSQADHGNTAWARNQCQAAAANARRAAELFDRIAEHLGDPIPAMGSSRKGPGQTPPQGRSGVPGRGHRPGPPRR